MSWNKEAIGLCSSYTSCNECNLIPDCKFEESKWIGVHTSNSEFNFDDDNATFDYFKAQNLKVINIWHVIDIEKILNYNIIAPIPNFDLGVYKWKDDGSKLDGQWAENKILWLRTYSWLDGRMKKVNGKIAI